MKEEAVPLRVPLVEVNYTEQGPGVLEDIKVAPGVDRVYDLQKVTKPCLLLRLGNSRAICHTDPKHGRSNSLLFSSLMSQGMKIKELGSLMVQLMDYKN